MQRRREKNEMNSASLNAFQMLCLSALCFGFGTITAGVVFSVTPDDVLPIAWLMGCIVFGIAMAVAYG